MEEKNQSCMVYIGTYTQHESEGIYAFRFDIATGKIKSMGLMAKAENPSYITFDHSRQHLYAVYETEDYKDRCGGAVGAYSIQAQSGNLLFLNEQSVLGRGPCHLCVEDKMKAVITANYTDGSLSVFRQNNDGSIGDMTDYVQHAGCGLDKVRQEMAHAHYVTFTPDQKYIYAVDLGIDQVKVYNLNTCNHTLEEVKELVFTMKGGSGPRHIAFHPKLSLFYLVNELSSEIMVFDTVAEGHPALLQTISTLPDSYRAENLCAAIKITPDGRFLYVSNRGHDSLAGFQIDKQSGKLELISHTSSGGNWPRDLEIDPYGKWILVANQESNEITAFQIQGETGILKPKGRIAKLSKPVCIKMMELTCL